MKRTIWAILSAFILIMMLVGHVVIWGILIVCTAGILAPFYLFGVAKTLIDATVID